MFSFLRAQPAAAPSSEAGAEPSGQALFIDVRSAGEFASGYLEGAVNVPLDQLQQRMPQLVPDLDRELVLYCASGARSAFACGLLQQLGYRRARNGGGVSMLALTTQRPVRHG
jgi:phage shock protein E